MDIQKLFEKEQTQLGRRIESLRTAMDISQKIFGLKCEINRTEISRIENGIKNLEFLTIIKLAEGAGIELLSLFDYKDEWPLKKTARKQDFIARAEKEKKMFGKRIKQIREHRGLTQIDVDISTGIPDSDVSRIENALINLKFYSIFRIAKALKVRIADLFNYNGALPD